MATEKRLTHNTSIGRALRSLDHCSVLGRVNRAIGLDNVLSCRRCGYGRQSYREIFVKAYAVVQGIQGISACDKETEKDSI